MIASFNLHKFEPAHLKCLTATYGEILFVHLYVICYAINFSKILVSASDMKHNVDFFELKKVSKNWVW